MVKGEILRSISPFCFVVSSVDAVNQSWPCIFLILRQINMIMLVFLLDIGHFKKFDSLFTLKIEIMRINRNKAFF
jgi:hypothetical protein